MRLKYYKLTLRQMVKNKPFVLFLILVMCISGICVYIFNKNIEPTIKLICESKASSIAVKSSNIAVYNYIENIEYNDLINIQKDKNDRVTALNANVMEMNRISSNITTKLQEELEKNEVSEITLPLGSLFGVKLLGGYGPSLKLRIIPNGEIDVKYKSKFESAGINQTKHSIILEINTHIMILAPFFSNTKIFANQVVIAETIIVGDTPDSYYNIQGITGSDALNLVE